MTESSHPVAAPGAAEDPGRLLLKWRYHPVREGGWRLAVVVGFLLGVPALIGWMYGPFFTALALVILGGSMGTYFLPTDYAFYVGGVETRFLAVTRRFKWDQFRSFYPDRNGVLLSPFPAPSRLENFRGLFVRFARNRDQVIGVIRERVLPPTKDGAAGS
jgi:hypothetical protein